MQIINVGHIEDALWDLDVKINREDWTDYEPHQAAEEVLEWATDAIEKAVRTGGVDID